MNISLNLLKEFVTTKCTALELADKLRVSTCEVEEIVNWSERFDGVVIGTVTKVEAHPQADRLRIATVSLGSSVSTIVCGAPNLAEGQTVAVATPGTTLYPAKGEPFTIEVATLRGQRSEGMLCASDELGLPLVQDDGILILPDELKAGTLFAEALGLSDTVLDLEITPNRPDLLSYIGIAREVAALEKHPLKELFRQELTPASKKGELSVTIDDSRLCSRYSAVAVENVRMEASPLWLQVRLILSGIRPINTVVDVTNYVMLELGQPLHAFDADKTGNSLTVRAAKAGETITTLDNQNRELAAGDIVIAGSKGPVALAGVMGGLNSSVDQTTTRIILESATFAGGQIRRTSRRLGLRSEASSRFEKGLDTEATVAALERAAYLLKEVCGAQPGTLTDIHHNSHHKQSKIHISFDKIQQVLGVHISAAECKTILKHLGFEVASMNKSSFDAIPPSWRGDVTLPEDIVEELIRIWGFDRLPLTIPTGTPVAPQPNSPFRTKYQARRALASRGYHEAIHLSFTSAKDLQTVGINPEECLRLPNPLSEETAYLIPNHLANFVTNVSERNAAETELKLFEIGHVFLPPTQEHERLSLLVRTNEAAEHLYRQLKADLDHLAAVMRRSGEGLAYVPSTEPYAGLDTASILEIRCQGQAIGRLGLVSSSVVAAAKIKRGKQLLFAELDLGTLLKLPTIHRSYKPVSVFPSSQRDITAVVDSSLPAGKLTELVAAHIDAALTQDWQLLDIFSGKPLPEGKKSITLRFTYNAGDRTLTEAEIAADQERLTQLLRTELQAEIN